MDPTARHIGMEERRFCGAIDARSSNTQLLPLNELHSMLHHKPVDALADLSYFHFEVTCLWRLVVAQ